jgi:hypothetical protein
MPHRKTIKHYHEPGDFHELTFSCYRRMPLLTNDAWRGHFARGLDEALAAEKFHLLAFVLMPEHVHLLVWPTCPDATLRSSTFISILCGGACASRRWIGGGRVRSGMPPRGRPSMPIHGPPPELFQPCR